MWRGTPLRTFAATPRHGWAVAILLLGGLLFGGSGATAQSQAGGIRVTGLSASGQGRCNAAQVMVTARNIGIAAASTTVDVLATSPGGQPYRVGTAYFTLAAGQTDTQSVDWIPLDAGPTTLQVTGGLQGTIDVPDNPAVPADQPCPGVPQPAPAAPAPAPGAGAPLVVTTDACFQITGPTIAQNSCPTASTDALRGTVDVGDATNQLFATASRSRVAVVQFQSAVSDAIALADQGRAELQRAAGLDDEEARRAAVFRGLGLVLLARHRLNEANAAHVDFEQGRAGAMQAQATLQAAATRATGEMSPSQLAAGATPAPQVLAVASWTGYQTTRVVEELANLDALAQAFDDLGAVDSAIADGEALAARQLDDLGVQP